MSEANPVYTPMELSRVEVGGVNKEICNVRVPYREAIGSLMYLAIATRPDIAYAVNHLSQALENPGPEHWQAVKRIFKYLRGTTKLGILYTGQGELEGFCDSDYAGDTVSRKSVSGFVSLLGGGAITWFSQKQKSVALSTTEAEYMAASEAAKELIWLKRLVNELTGTSSCPALMSDSMSAVKLAKNNEFHRRSKHIDVRYHFVREKLEEGIFRIVHIPGECQAADVLTKPLPAPRHKSLISMLGLVESPV